MTTGAQIQAYRDRVWMIRAKLSNLTASDEFPSWTEVEIEGEAVFWAFDEAMKST